jgi:hypothetical protein
MANLRRRIPQQTESLFIENHETFFNSIDPITTWTATSAELPMLILAHVRTSLLHMQLHSSDKQLMNLPTEVTRDIRLNKETR